ncbi:alpha/beta hydrolase [Pseudohaliea sp.]|uniref:alpha/beta fold hydrolase n=1 Tax=Pseudohaliea sp. TaxID=2740289 RepID=UPI0032ECC237
MPTPIRCAYIDIPAGQIHYRHAAGDGIPFVYLHQTASSSKMWLKVMERLSDLGPHYAIDTPGFGGSFDPEESPSMSQYVDWMAEALAALDVTRAHIVGHHTGACIGCELAARYPSLAASVTLLGPVPLTDEEREEFSRHFGAPFETTASGGYLMDNWYYLDRLGAHADLTLFHRELWDMLRAQYGRVKSYAAVWGQDFTGFFEAITVPLAIMCAQDDVLWPFFDRAKELRPDALAAVPGGANFEPDLDPDTVAGTIRQLVTSIAD